MNSTINSVMSLPRQTVSYNKKKTESWKKECMDFFDGAFSASSVRLNQKLTNFRLVNGEFDFKNYDYATAPWGVEMGDLPAQFRHYPILNNPLETLIGEEINRPFRFRVKAEGEDVTNEFIREKTKALISYAEQKILSEFQDYIKQQQQSLIQKANQIQNPSEKEQILQQGNNPKSMLPEEIQEYFSKRFLTTVEKTGNKILNAYYKKEDLARKFVDGFRDALICADEIYWVGIRNDEAVVEHVNPINVVYSLNDSSFMIHECEWVVRREFMSPSQIVDKWWKDLSKSEIERLERFDRSLTSGTTVSHAFGTESIVTGNNQFTDVNWGMSLNTDGLSSDSLLYPLDPTGGLVIDFKNNSSGTSSMFNTVIRVIHAEWVGKRKIGFVKFNDEKGFLQTKFVDETYTLMPNEEIEWNWINEIWEGTKIADNIYINVRAKKNQARSFNKLYGAKLGYVGVVYGNRNSKSVSLIDRMKPWQELYNIMMWKLEEDINSDIGKVLLFSLNQIPKDKGWDIDKWMYYIRSMKIALIDEASEGIKSGFNQFSAVDMSMGQLIQQKIQILDYIERKCSEIIGINPQRLGSPVASGETATANQSAMRQSYSQTEYLFNLHAYCKSLVLTQLIECAKMVYHKGGMLRYVLDDLSIDYIEIDGDKINMCDYGVFITDNNKDIAALDSLKQLLQPAMQNGASLYDAATILTEDSISELKDKLKKLSDNTKQMTQMKMQMEKDELAKKQNNIEAELKLRKDISDSQIAKDIEVAKIKTYGKLDPSLEFAKLDHLASETDDKQAHEKELHEKESQMQSNQFQQHNDLENKKADLDKQKHDDKMNLEKEKIEANLKMKKIQSNKPNSK